MVVSGVMISSQKIYAGDEGTNDEYVVSVEIPKAFNKVAYNAFPDFEEYDDTKIEVATMYWVSTAEDVAKEQQYAAGNRDIQFDVLGDKIFLAGETYYGVAIVSFEDETTGTIRLKETDYVHKISEVTTEDNTKTIYAFSVTIPYITVTIEFGTGHENYAGCVANASIKNEETPVPMEVTGSTLTYKAGAGTSYWFEVLKPIRNALGDYSSVNGDIDNNEKLNDLSKFNLKPISDYADETEWEEDLDKISGNLNKDATLYVQWLKIIGGKIAITRPVCGTEVKLVGEGERKFPDVVPEIKVISDNISISDYGLYWIENEGFFTGTFKGGEEYLATAPLYVDFKYYLDLNKLEIENGEIVIPNPASSYIKTTAVHDWGEWVVDKENNVKTRKCKGCGETETTELSDDSDVKRREPTTKNYAPPKTGIE